MKKIIVLIVAFTFLLGMLEEIQAVPKFTKLWEYHHASWKAWEFKWIDEWGGSNWWCVEPGGQCHNYDWKAEYNNVLQGQNPTPTETCTSAYGHSLVTNAANEAEIELPELDLPTYTEIWDE
jgi:hypothetical protein